MNFIWLAVQEHGREGIIQEDPIKISLDDERMSYAISIRQTSSQGESHLVVQEVRWTERESSALLRRSYEREDTPAKTTDWSH